MAVPLRTTQLVVETLDVIPASPVHATQVAAEIVFIGTPINEARVTELCCELIVIPLTVPREACPVTFPSA